ncbi:hypothetical protein [Paracoccus sp. S-4012]|uniref:hypothetical protein n=1 Tax=Paracoccus sp. S-4012 TaxID=2665648 RepID=UPI0018A2457F|nr:hypothetical protein [Paracoccus sp. S-4012]
MLKKGWDVTHPLYGVAQQTTETSWLDRMLARKPRLLVATLWPTGWSGAAGDDDVTALLMLPSSFEK